MARGDRLAGCRRQASHGSARVWTVGDVGIGIGRSLCGLHPSHITRHAGPHRAVREVEVAPSRSSLVPPFRLRHTSSVDSASPRPSLACPDLHPASDAMPARETQVTLSPSRSALHCRRRLPPLLTSRSADLTVLVALSGTRRDLPRQGRTPSLHDRRIYATDPWSGELRGALPAHPGRHRLLSGSCPSARSFDPRFLPTVGHPSAVALLFTRCDQRTTGLPPARMRPCWAHNDRRRAEARLLSDMIACRARQALAAFSFSE